MIIFQEIEDYVLTKASSLVRETVLTTNDFVMPMFVMEGENAQEAIPSMPGIFHRTVDLTVKECKELFSLGCKSGEYLHESSRKFKDNLGTEAWNPHGLMQRTIREIKNAIPEMIVMPDVALDPYSIYGHDGIITNGQVTMMRLMMLWQECRFLTQKQVQML